MTKKEIENLFSWNYVMDTANRDTARLEALKVLALREIAFQLAEMNENLCHEIIVGGSIEVREDRN